MVDSEFTMLEDSSSIPDRFKKFSHAPLRSGKLPRVSTAKEISQTIVRNWY